MVYNDRDSTERHSFLRARKLPYFQSGPSKSQLNQKHRKQSTSTFSTNPKLKSNMSDKKKINK
jgi:hypothetical protein